MTQEDKELLFKDLCARLPYGVKGRVYAETTNAEYDTNGDMIFFDSAFDVTLDTIDTSTEEIHVIAIGNEDTIAFIEDQQTWGSPYTIDEFKPYLRPMSSMTDEEINILCSFIYGIEQVHLETGIKYCTNALDWLNAHHFDYQGLIERGLAIVVTEENNPYKG